MASETALRGILLCKSYAHYPVLTQVSLSVYAGECYALFGANGAGKTTLMKILSTLLSPTSGHVEILGCHGANQKAEARASLFLLGHGTQLYDDLTALENLQFALGLRGLSPSMSEMKSALDRVGIGPFARYRSRDLSAGMKRRLAIAKVWLARPKVLLMDEPYAALDVAGIEMTHDLIRDARRREAAVLFTSHDVDRAARVADRAGTLQNGRLEETPSPAPRSKTDARVN